MYFKDRRCAPRLRVRLGFSLSVLRPTKLKRLNAREHALKGHTRDISVSGLALLLPQIHLEGYHLAAEDREMLLTLELAGGSVSMVVVSKRYEKLDTSELGCNYLIGAQIVRMEERDRIRYENLISSGLKNNAPSTESEAS